MALCYHLPKTVASLTLTKSGLVYEFSCQCEARYVRRTTQRLADRIKQYVPTSISKKSNTARELPPRVCRNNKSKIYCESAIGQHLIANPECAKTYQTTIFGIIGQARSSFQLSVLGSVYIKTQKSSFSHWDSSSKQWTIGPNWPLLGPIRRILSHAVASRYIFRLSNVFIL